MYIQIYRCRYIGINEYVYIYIYMVVMMLMTTMMIKIKMNIMLTLLLLMMVMMMMSDSKWCFVYQSLRYKNIPSTFLICALGNYQQGVPGWISWPKTPQRGLPKSYRGKMFHKWNEERKLFQITTVGGFNPSQKY